MIDLFANAGALQRVVDIELAGADLKCWPNFYSVQESQRLFSELYEGLDWQSEMIQVFGRKVRIPRRTAWYGDSGANYRYSGLTHRARALPVLLEKIRQKLSLALELNFNSALGNLYRDGCDSMGWHSDDEPELGISPVIASLSFGASRFFDLRSVHDSRVKHRVEIKAGSLLLMAGETQKNWQHSVPKQTTVSAPRINLTFRNICR
ncbi:MAG: alpha-ketoglutarate-dependent dioxygenase AlkB [Proteobacteria bacterium]|jgi:alkylated DNA repair dioxygenase AlkB|nr:alpha-ketoglutarate-dependent dioxygenase AlkB [Pseudomonadota bacterium]